MGTKQQIFAQKVKDLHDYQWRILHAIVPVPSGLDGATILKFFSQTLLNVLRDVKAKESPLEMVKSVEADSTRMTLYPHLDYRGLYNELTQIIDIVPLIQYGLHEFGQALLKCLGCLLPFLENDMIDTLPYLTASTIVVLPSSLHQEIVNQLCFYVLPFTLTRRSDDGQENYASHSVAAIIMLVFQYAENTAQHSQLLECLMSMKSDLVRDVLCVMAHGSTAARASAAKLLFHFWPAFNPTLVDRKSLPNKFVTEWPAFVCQRDECPNAGNAGAAKVCYDHDVSIKFANERPPPLYLCIECANDIHSRHEDKMFFDILHPMQQVSQTCESKNCRSTEKAAVSVCFTADCVSYNGNRPIRFCQHCHDNKHNNRRGGDHIVHTMLPQAWDLNEEMQSYLVESVVNLLKEAQWRGLELRAGGGLLEPGTGFGLTSPGLPNNNESPLLVLEDTLSQEERQLLGRYGVWLLVGVCTPRPDTPTDILGRLMSMLFHWFHVTAYSSDGQAESTVERLKTEFVCSWLKEVCKTHFNVFVSCLLPHPPDYARVGGHWDTLSSRTLHLKDGLNRLFCLVPYDVVTPEIWDHVMPHWMEAIASDVPDKELPLLKILLSKILDPNMGPLGFDAKQIFNFIAIRFHKTTSKVSEQALNWLQILTTLEIIIPLPLLLNMFTDGVYGMIPNEKTVDKDRGTEKQEAALHDRPAAPSHIAPVVEDDCEHKSSMSDDDTKASRHIQFETAAELNLSCCILMIDVLLKQLELQEVEPHCGLSTSTCQDSCRLLKAMVAATWTGTHTCEDENECVFCESCVMWYQLTLKLVTFLSPKDPAEPPDPPLVEPNGEDSHKSPPDSDKKYDAKPDVVINMPLLEIHTVGGVLVHMPNIMTATVVTETEPSDIPDDRSLSTVSRPAMYADSDVVPVAKSGSLVGEKEESVDVDGDDNDENCWLTSLGKFRFSLDSLPEHLQFIHQLLMELPHTVQADILYHILQCLNILILYGDALSKASKDHKGFVIWCQENLLIKNLWELCNSERSHICEVSVPLLLRCIGLPAGSDAFWKVIQNDFHHTDWRVRFTAVERVTVIARFMDSTPLRNCSVLQAALANAFCYLISSMDDLNVHVSQRATLYLGTIHDNAIRSLILCLETQFDTVIVDRPMVLQSLYQLHNCLSDRKILTWEFFLNRFDTLFLEAQINLEKTGDILHAKDLRNDNSEIFLRKLQRAQEALSQSDGSGGSIKTLSASFGHKWPYKRTMSAPAAMVPRQDTKQEKEKIYSRQYSAPILKRKTSRFGLDGHIHSLNTGEEGNFAGILHRIIDLEEADHETMHLLVFLLMQFLSRADQASPSEEKGTAKSQSIVLRHLYLLLGYNSSERERPGFYVPPGRLRTSPVFNVFLSNLPQLLDQNYHMGKHMLPTSLLLLHYSPSPQQHSHTPDIQHAPLHSLWYLEPNARRSWLMSLIVILYKYQYASETLKVDSLIRIVLNTLDAQQHVCRRIPATLVVGAPPSRSRDVSQPSLGADGERGSDKLETPPLSPMYSADSSYTGQSKGSKHQALFHQKSPGVGSGGVSLETHLEEDDTITGFGSRPLPSSYSTEADDSESELAAIPESPNSDSSRHDAPLPETMAMQTPAPTVAPEVAPAVAPAVAAPTMDLTSDSSAVRRPVWFLGSDDKSLQKCLGGDQNPKWGVREGMKMMVSSSLFGATQPGAAAAAALSTIGLVAPTNNNNNSNNNKQRSNSGNSIISLPALPPTAAVVTAATGVFTRALSLQGSPDTEKEPEKELEEWRTDQPHGSPIPRPLGRQKSAESTSPYGFAQPSCNMTIPAAMCPLLSCTTHPPWQLDMYNKTSVPSPPPPPQSLSQLPSQLSAPAVERLLPIGTARTIPSGKNNSRFRPEEAYGSPESPLSKMDIMTIGSPVDIDSENNLSDVTSIHSLTGLEVPPTERLLPIGSSGKESVPALVERVRQVLSLHSENAHESIAQEQTLSRKEATENLHSEIETCEHVLHGPRSVSPRRLIKQVALESPPPNIQPDIDDGHSSFYRTVHAERKASATFVSGRSEDQLRSQRHRARKAGGLYSASCHTMAEAPKHTGSWASPTVQPQLDPLAQQACHAAFELKQSAMRVGEDCVYDRCSECGAVHEEYSDEELGLCIVALGTFIHREPALAAPLMPEILASVARVALNTMYPWQTESNVYLPGGAVSVARQFLRCVLHQLAPSGVFMQIFQTHVDDKTRLQFFRSVAQALQDFNELNPITPLQMLLEGLNSKKTLTIGMVPVVLRNMACYLDCLPLEAGLGPGVSTWGALLNQLETLFRRLALQLPSMENVTPLLRIMVSVLRVPGIGSYKGILEPFSKVLSYGIQNFVLKYHYLVDLCFLCNRGFTKERDKLFLTRMVVLELVQALKFKTSIPDANFLMLINFVLQDAGGFLPLSPAMSQTIPLWPDTGPVFNTGAAECMRTHLGDALEFLSDFHTLSRIKSVSKDTPIGLNEDTLGGVIKSGIAQYVALELSRGNGRDNRAVAKYLPWLCNTLSSLQQGQRDIMDCISHIRLLSWLLLGALTHTAAHSQVHCGSHAPCHPIQQESSCHILDHIQGVMAGFAESSKASVLHMSSLFHAFILCQLWTIYLEQMASTNTPNSDAHVLTMSILLDFWGKVTPSILNLVSQSRMLAEMVNLHFLSLLEALLESNSTILSKLLPVWNPVLHSHHHQISRLKNLKRKYLRSGPKYKVAPSNEFTALIKIYKSASGHNFVSSAASKIFAFKISGIAKSGNTERTLPGHLQMRLQHCQNYQPNISSVPLPAPVQTGNQPIINGVLLKWLQRLQFKMGQIEVQSSTATQFYTV